tara:strand:- start:370 stop:1233 length:864 start_codon:yes stop_codon:yes gene_type:complete
MIKINPLVLVLTLLFASCQKEDEPTIEEPTIEEQLGYNMLLMGHSFFKNYAHRIGEIALDAGFVNHTQTVVFSSGASGFPINLWNDTGVDNQYIKAILDNGDVDLFGMVADTRLLPDESLAGHRYWIDYAIQNNPEVAIFLSISSPSNPLQWVQMAEALGYATVQDAYYAHINQDCHAALIDTLRAEFPSTNIFSIPTGKASVNLWQMYHDDLLLDDTQYMGAFENSLFTDSMGHQGEMIEQTGALMWLKGIYNVDLTANDFETGFETDLHAVAEGAMNSHDSDYNQ